MRKLLLTCIYKDWSRNSTFMGETVNEAGLPLTMRKQIKYSQPFLDFGAGAEMITYDCD